MNLPDIGHNGPFKNSLMKLYLNFFRGLFIKNLDIFLPIVYSTNSTIKKINFRI
jgi:hypothetical protein